MSEPLEERLRRIPEFDSGPLEWQELGTGLSNRVYRVRCKDQDFVLRLNQDRPGTDRARESLVYRCLAGSELAPEVVADRPDEGYLITEYFEEPQWQPRHTRERERLQDLARSLRRLHEIAAESVPTLDPLDAMAGMLNDDAVRERPGYPAIRSNLQTLFDDVEQSGYNEVRQTLCHLDLLHSNILGAVRPMLVDWEYASRANPLLDLATFINYHDLDQDDSEPFLEAYFGGPYGAYRSVLMTAQRIAQALELLWLICRDGQSPLPEAPASRLRRLLLVWT